MSTRRTSNGSSISAPQPASTSQVTEQPNLLPHAPQYYPKGTIPNSPLAVSVLSALLGGLACASLSCAAQPFLRTCGSQRWTWARPQLGLYGCAMGMFHLWEFATTAGWNPQKLSVDAFLLNNTVEYHYAHAFGLTEYFLTSYLYPRKYDTWISGVPWLTLVISVLVSAQALRSFAMIHASTSFSHIVKAVKHDDHVLIKHGVYQYSRHPSYAGFFYWAISTQLLLGNIFSTAAFIVVLSRFFRNRIIDEERHLVRFFGDEYVEYRKQIGTGLPFWVNSA